MVQEPQAPARSIKTRTSRAFNSTAVLQTAAPGIHKQRSELLEYGTVAQALPRRALCSHEERANHGLQALADGHLNCGETTICSFMYADNLGHQRGCQVSRISNRAPMSTPTAETVLTASPSPE